MGEPFTVLVPVTVVERVVWELTPDEMRQLGITVGQRSMAGHTYDLWFGSDGEQLSPNGTVLVPVGVGA